VFPHNVSLIQTGGQRTWIQVLSNGGMATQLAVLYILDSGCGERPINFLRDYRSSWLSLGILGKFMCGRNFRIGDTNEGCMSVITVNEYQSVYNPILIRQ
jgi:hypothetical protein